MNRILAATVLVMSVEAAFDPIAQAQFAPPILPQAPRAPVPGCLPGQFCPNAPQFGFRCQTPQFWCGLPQPGPIGIQCYCNSPMGPVTGWVAQ